MSSQERDFYEFGPFRIDTLERQLLRGEEPVALTPKAYDTLLALVENAGHALDKDQLLRRIWPDTFVEEGSLTRNISVLRRALDDPNGQYIETLPKRGYRFVAAVKQSRRPSEYLVLQEEHTVSSVLIEETETTAGRRFASALATGAILLLVLAAGMAYFTARRSEAPAVRSLAVLPLKSATREVADQHLELGIADGIISKLSRIPALTVRPTGAIRKYLGSEPDPLQAARELKVDAVLDGTLQHVGDRVRVSVNILKASSGSSLWAHTFDLPFDNIFAVEDEVAQQVAAQLRLHLDTAEQARLPRHHTRNPEAYEHYLKGLFSVEMRSVSGSSRAAIETALARFKKATELDPSYAQAYAQIAICQSQLMNFYQPDENRAEEARRAASRAYALAPDLPDLHVFRAWMLWGWWGRYQVEEAIRELRGAGQYSFSAANSLLGNIYSHCGLNEQAIRELKRAGEIDPTSSQHQDRLAEAYVWAGRYDDARAAYDQVLAIEPDSRSSLVFSAIPFLQAHKFEEARRRLERARAVDQRNIVAPSYKALLTALQGDFQKAETEMPPRGEDAEKMLGAHHAFFAFACIYALQGKSREAVHWLSKTVETGMPNYPMFARDPNLARIRTSPEFAQFMAALKPRWEAMNREFS